MAHPRARRTGRSASPAIAAAAVVYLAVLAWLPSDGFWITDNGVKFIQLQAIAAGDFRSYDIPWPGRAVDPGLQLSPLPPPFGQVIDGRLYAAYSPVFAALSVPFHALLGRVGLLLLPLLGSLLTWLAVRRLAERLAPDEASERPCGELAVGILAFATPVAFYTFTFWEHLPALACSSWALVACLELRESGSDRASAALGLAAAGAIYFRTDAYLLALVLGAVACSGPRRSLRSTGLFALTTVLALAPLWTFHWLALGHPLGLHLGAQSWGDDLTTHAIQRIEVFQRLFVNTHRNPVLSLIAALPFLALLPVSLGAFGTFSARRERFEGRLPALALVGALGAGMIVAWGHLSAPDPMPWLLSANGLFAASPIVILALLPGAPTRAGPRRTLLAVLGLHAGLYALLVPPLNAAGVHWGCRFLLIAFPIFAAVAAPAAVALAHRGRGLRAVLVLVAALSVGLQLYSLDLLHARKTFVSEVTERIADTRGDAVVTSVWHLPADLAGIFFERPIFFTRAASQLPDIVEQLASRGEQPILVRRFTPGTPRAPDTFVLQDHELGFSTLLLRAPNATP